MRYKIIKLKKIKEEYKKIGLNNDSLGLILEEKDNKCLALFFNSFNQGDYLTLVISKFDLAVTEVEMPKDICAELEDYIQKNLKHIINKSSFEEIPFEECDQVELIVEKEKYLKCGLCKGSKGIIASNKAIKNKILVEFDGQTDNFDGFILVDFKDIIKI